MRKIKRIIAVLVMVCMLCPGLSMVANAASAEIHFSDPSTTVGAEVEVKAQMTSASTLNNVEITLTYDSSMLRFISGENASGGKGTITLTGSGESTTLDFSIKFQALQEGNTKIEVSGAEGIDSAGTALEITSGSSAVTIGPGDPSLITEEEDTASVTDGIQVEVDGAQYVITNDFSDALIPEGFVKSEMKFEGETCAVITQEASGTSAMYLTPADGGDADFFLYSEDKGNFTPMEEVEIANGRYIIPLRDDGSVNLPERFQKTTLTLNGKEFDTWQDTENAEYYVIYALNTDGQKVLYQYDTLDKTYQRYVQTESVDDTAANKKAAKGIWGKILSLIEDFLDIAVILIAALILFLLIILTVVAVKLRHRNLELDDLYDEYGIDLDDEEEEDEDDFEDPVPAKKKSSKKGEKKGKKQSQSAKQEGPAVRKPVKQVRIEDEDDFEAFEPLDEEAFDNFEGYYEESDFDDIGFDGSDDFIDDTSDLLSSHPEKRKSHSEMDDTFQMDIIDLD